MGGVGDLFYNVFRCSGFGLSSVLFPIILSFWGLFLFKNSDEYKQALKLTAYAFVLMVLTAMTGAWISDNNTNYSGKFGWSLFIYFKTILGFGIYLFLPISYLLIVSIYYQISIYTLFLSTFKAFKMVVKFIYIFIKELIQRKTAQIVDKTPSSNSTIPINGSGQNESPNSEMWADELDNLNEINSVENTEKMEHVESYDVIKSSKNIDSLDETNSSEAPIIEISEEAKIDSVDLDGLSNRKVKII